MRTYHLTHSILTTFPCHNTNPSIMQYQHNINSQQKPLRRTPHTSTPTSCSYVSTTTPYSTLSVYLTPYPTPSPMPFPTPFPTPYLPFPTSLDAHPDARPDAFPMPFPTPLPTYLPYPPNHHALLSTQKYNFTVWANCPYIYMTDNTPGCTSASTTLSINYRCHRQTCYVMDPLFCTHTHYLAVHGERALPPWQ